jgi:hypothetical protein
MEHWGLFVAVLAMGIAAVYGLVLALSDYEKYYRD